MWWTLLPWKSIARRPAVSSIQMPSAFTMALRHGVETDWRRKYFSSSASSVCASGSRFFSAHARRCGDRFVSLSDSEGVVVITECHPGRAQREPGPMLPQSPNAVIHGSRLSRRALGRDDTCALSSPPPGLQAREEHTVEEDLQQLRAEGGEHGHGRQARGGGG